MTPLIFVGTCDLAGKVRGKAFPADQLNERLVSGVGWTPTNIQIACFDNIADSPFGATNDLLLVPQMNSGFSAIFGDRTERFMLGDILTLEGEPWLYCTRNILKLALDRLQNLAGVRLLVAFEHEFQIKDECNLIGEGFGRIGFESQRPLCETLVDQISQAGLTPDSVMKEYGKNQFEIVIAPEMGLLAADAAVVVRELTRSTARYYEETATFSPILDTSSVGNGVHIHFSFIDEEDQPIGYDPENNGNLSKLASTFSAGILKYLDSIIAFTAPSVISYYRLTPHRWSASYNNLGFRDREAAIRICPISSRSKKSFAKQFNLEFRAADAAASPHVALAAIIHAGCQGVEENLLEPPILEGDLSQISANELSKHGINRLPETLESALERTVSNSIVKGWFPENFIDIYAKHKSKEIEHVNGLDVAECCAAYANTY